MKIAIIGSGYVGTVTGTCLAEMGHQVICADLKEGRMKNLQEGKVHFYEEALEPLIRGNREEGRLEFTTDIVSAVRKSEVIFLCIGTPLLPSGKPDFNALSAAVKSIAAGMDGYRLIIEKSTMPIKTGEWLASLLKEQLPADIDFDIAAVPQFLREGHAVKDFMHPDRIIIGANTQRAIDTIVEIYRPLNAPLLITDINSAELIKHATNAFLATKISFINSIAQVCEKTGADITSVARGLGLDRRIGPEYLSAGIGYGGIFFPKDINSLLNIAEEFHINLDLLKQVDVINRYQRISFIEKIDEALGKNLSGKTIAIWGLSYRPHTDDMRDTPSVTIIRGLEKRGAKIRAYDPLSMEPAKELLPDITYCSSAYEAAKGADAIAILTEWDEFAYINFMKLRQESQCRLIVDGRNLFSPSRMKTLGYTYVSIGRQRVAPEKVAVGV
ncbi:MAG TPA: UDP-glucose/GDP-mannose dehydrogenase family protein [Oculatellaceae cyanobacterium]